MEEIMLMVPGYIIPAYSVIGLPPASTAGEWIEAGQGVDDSIWEYTPEQSAYVIYKVK